MASVEHLQSYLRESVRERSESVHVPPFTIFFHPHDSFHFFNYAIPDASVGGDLHESLGKLREAFAARGRQPRFEFIEGFAPELVAALQAAGFVEESRLHLMICTPDTYQSALVVPDLSIMMLTPDSPLADVQAFQMVQQQGFDPDNHASVDEAEAEKTRAGIGASGMFLARLGDQAVGVAQFTPPLRGTTEVVGVATLEAFRRRGIAAVLTAAAVEAAFARGVEVACLTAGDERAGRVYERVGFRPFATMLAYQEPT